MNFRGYPLDRRPAWGEPRMPGEAARPAHVRRSAARRPRSRAAQRRCVLPGA